MSRSNVAQKSQMNSMAPFDRALAHKNSFGLGSLVSLEKPIETIFLVLWTTVIKRLWLWKDSQ